MLLQVRWLLAALVRTKGVPRKLSASVSLADAAQFKGEINT